MIVSSFNIQNDTRVYNSEKSKDIFNFIKSNKIDILGIQEMFYKCDKDLKRLIDTKYDMVGKYRYFFKPFYPIKNERNPIISKHRIIDNITCKLPSKNAKYNRIITKAIINYKGHIISVYNTHTEISNDEIKKAQLERIFELLERDKNPIILMGDFNLKRSDSTFSEFVKRLESINIKRIGINTNTYKTHKDNEGIDHIFISNDFKIKKKNVIKDLEISDHYPLVVELDID